MPRLVLGWRTPTAVLAFLTEPKGPYRWWGVVVGRWFVGVMRSEVK